MNWLTSVRNKCNHRLSFEGVAVCVIFSSESSGSNRVKLVLSDKFIASYRLQSGDKLQAGFSEHGKLMLRRNPHGNTITGKGFSKKRAKTQSKGSSTTQPYVAFESNTYPAVYAWARRFDNRTWVELTDHETHWETLQ